MTDEAWKEVTVALMKGYRLLPYTKENPNWRMFEFLDGFGSHERVLEAHEMRRDANVDSGKEESQTSHAEPMNHGSLASAAALPWSKFMNTPDGYILGLASRLTRSIGTGPPSIALRLHTCANKHTCGVGERELSSLPGTSSFVENAYFGN